MASDTDRASHPPNGVVEDRKPAYTDDPVTPPDNEILAPNSSQLTLPSTEAPASPIDPNQSFKTEINDDRLTSSAVIPSSLTPPPSSQVPAHNGNGVAHGSYLGSQRTALFSPPATTLNNLRRDGILSSDYSPPAPQQVLEATADELRAMMQTCIAEHAKLKMEAAHHKLQYNLLSIQADEDAKRAEVEHDMVRSEVEALRRAENSRQARRDLSAASESAQVKYLQMKTLYEAAVEENEVLEHRLKLAKKVIQQKEEEVSTLVEDRDMLLNRIRENREHFRVLCSPGGIFHGAMTPKQQTVTTPVQYRGTPRQTPKSAPRESRVDRDRGQEPITALIQVLSQENNSAPSTPTVANRPGPRLPAKHTRNVQSLSSLPTTPNGRPRGEYAGLLPSVDLVPQTEPTRRYSSKHFPPNTPTPARERRRKSRESTISAEDNEELARQALELVASSSMLSRSSRTSRRPLPSGHDDEEEEEEVFESQASQAASEMLRRDPRESFEVASSVGSRDGTPAPLEKSAKLQAKLFPGITKSGAEKRKFSAGAHTDDPRQDSTGSPSKKMRVGGPLGDKSKVGLGIFG